MITTQHGGKFTSNKDATDIKGKDIDVSEFNPVDRCLRNYVQVMPEKEKESKSGLILTDPNFRHKIKVMVVVKVGKGLRCSDGSYLEIPEFDEGDRVLVPEMGKKEFEVDGKWVYFIECGSIICKLKK